MTCIVRLKTGIAAIGIMLGVGCATTPAGAAVIITNVNKNLATGGYSFSFMGGTFNFTGTGSFPDYLAVSTSGGAAVRTVFGNPSTDYTNRGVVTYDQNTLGGYGSFASLTTIPTTNGNNFLGLRVMSGGQNYYGYLYSTNTTLNTYAFETSPNTAIRATTALAAVPEPAAWAMMMAGFGLLGSSMRRRRPAVSFT